MDFGRTTAGCEQELHQAHPASMLRRASRRNLDTCGAVSRPEDARAPSQHRCGSQIELHSRPAPPPRFGTRNHSAPKIALHLSPSPPFRCAQPRWPYVSPVFALFPDRQTRLVTLATQDPRRFSQLPVRPLGLVLMIVARERRDDGDVSFLHCGGMQPAIELRL